MKSCTLLQGLYGYAQAQQLPFPRGHGIFHFDRAFLAHYQYKMSLTPLFSGVEKKILTNYN